MIFLVAAKYSNCPHELTLYYETLASLRRKYGIKKGSKRINHLFQGQKPESRSFNIKLNTILGLLEAL